MYGKEGYAMVEGVDQLKYLLRILDQSNNNWTAIQRDIRRVWKV